MITLDTVISLLSQGDWFVLIDHDDAYFHISIHLKHHKYLCFHFNGIAYQFCSLPFGLSTALRTFTKCLAPVAAYLRLQGITIFPYIDDWLIVSHSYQPAINATHITLNTLQRLSLKDSFCKSHLKPS